MRTHIRTASDVNDIKVLHLAGTASTASAWTCSEWRLVSLDMACMLKTISHIAGSRFTDFPEQVTAIEACHGKCLEPARTPAQVNCR